MLFAVLIAGNQDPSYEARLEEHGDYADADVLLHPGELALLPAANQFVALFANGISGRSYTDR